MGLADDGYQIIEAVFDSSEIRDLMSQLPELDGKAGTRNLLRLSWCRELAAEPRILDLVRTVLGENAQVVRGILFDKTASANWVLGWHQDNKIAVELRGNRPEGFRSWSVMEGVAHCKPPQSVLERCLAVRIHLDDCDSSNGALRVRRANDLGSQVKRFDLYREPSKANLLAKVGVKPIPLAVMCAYPHNL